MLRATAQRITVDPTIVDAHLFLGAQCVVGTLVVYKGAASSDFKRLCSVAAGENFLPRHALDNVDMSTGTIQSRRSKFVCEGSTDSIVYFMPTTRVD